MENIRLYPYLQSKDASLISPHPKNDQDVNRYGSLMYAMTST